MPAPLIDVVPTKRYDETGDAAGWDFIEIDVSILVDGVPYVRPAVETAPCMCRRCFLHDDPAGCVAP